MREKLGYPLNKTTWRVGEQLPLLEGKKASDAWANMSFEKKEKPAEASRG